MFHLHGGVVERDEGGEQVQVASGEHQGKQDLTLSRNTCGEIAGGTILHHRNRFISNFLAFKQIVHRIYSYLEGNTSIQTILMQLAYVLR